MTAAPTQRRQRGDAVGQRALPGPRRRRHQQTSTCRGPDTGSPRRACPSPAIGSVGQHPRPAARRAPAQQVHRVVAEAAAGERPSPCSTNSPESHQPDTVAHHGAAIAAAAADGRGRCRSGPPPPASAAPWPPGTAAIMPATRPSAAQCAAETRRAGGRDASSSAHRISQCAQNAAWPTRASSVGTSTKSGRPGPGRSATGSTATPAARPSAPCSVKQSSSHRPEYWNVAGQPRPERLQQVRDQRNRVGEANRRAERRVVAADRPGRPVPGLGAEEVPAEVVRHPVALHHATRSRWDRAAAVPVSHTRNPAPMSPPPTTPPTRRVTARMSVRTASTTPPA